MKGFVYILQEENNGRFYVGSTDNLSRRLLAHNSGHTQTTRNMKKPLLVFSQEMPSLNHARLVERKIKKWKRRDFIEKIIKDGYIKS